MTAPPLFAADHHGFYQNGNRFYPKIQVHCFPLEDWSHGVRVPLRARLTDDLDWSKEKAMAEEIIASGKLLLWEIDLGLEEIRLNPEDSAMFYSLSIALEEFTKMIWPHFKAHTFGVVLYCGHFLPSHTFPVSYWETACGEWLEELGIAGGDLHSDGKYALYCAQVLSEYLHRLISFLPDAVLAFALIDVSGIGSAARCAQLFSKERFEHLNLAFKGAQSPFAGICWEEGDWGMGWIGKEEKTECVRPAPTAGLYLPGDNAFGASLTRELDALMIQLEKTQTPYRILPEEKLTELWDGLDTLIIPSCPISSRGERKLLGFAAAGGTVIRSKNEVDLWSL